MPWYDVIDLVAIGAALAVAAWWVQWRYCRRDALRAAWAHARGWTYHGEVDEGIVRGWAFCSSWTIPEGVIGG